MGTGDYSDDFQRDAEHRIAVCGYPVREVSKRLGVGAYSVCGWLRLCGAPTSKPRAVDRAAGSRRSKRDLPRVIEGRDVPEKGAP